MARKTSAVKDQVNPKFAFSYIRFSRSEQIKGDSLRRQFEATQAYCDRNGLTLDETLNLRDLGVSAFRGKNASQGALGAFTAAVASGRVPRGATLIVESLDRLSREELGRAQSLILSILEQGITIVTLSPEREYTPGSANNLGAAIEIIVTRYRAHEESAMKSQRIGAAWASKRKNIRTKKLTSQCPSWLALSDDKTEFRVLPEAAQTVGRIFRMATEGYGVSTIARRFNTEGVSPISRTKTWRVSFVHNVLRGRSVLGEFQPRKGTGGNSQPVGDPVLDYYPAIVDEQTFYAAQNALTARRTVRGRRGKCVSNLFTGLVFNAVDGASMVMVTKGAVSRREKRLVSSAAVRGERGSHNASIRYEVFEQQMLTWLAGLDGAAGNSDPGAAALGKELQAVGGMLGDVTSRIEKVESRLVDGPTERFEAMLDLLEQLKANAKELGATREALKAKLHGSRAGGRQAFRTAWQKMLEAPADQLERLRSRLKAAIPSVVDRLDVTIEPDGKVRHVLATVSQKGLPGTSHIYFVARGPKSAWLSIGSGGKVDLAKLRKARYVPFSWKGIPRADETDMPVPAPLVKGTPLAEFAPGADDDWVEDVEDSEDD